MAIPRRWLQFSLRGMLALLTVLLIVLGWATDRARKQHRAIEAIEQVGGVVLFSGTPDAWETQSGYFRLIPLEAHSPRRTWMETLLSGFEFRQVRAVVFRTSKSRWFRHGPKGSGGVGIESEGRIFENDIIAAIPRLVDLRGLRAVYLEGTTKFNDGASISEMVEGRLKSALPGCEIIRDSMQMATNVPSAN